MPLLWVFDVKKTCNPPHLWYINNMKNEKIKDNYTSEELNQQLGLATFVGVNLRIYRVATSKGTYIFKCKRVPRTTFFNVTKMKLR